MNIKEILLNGGSVRFPYKEKNTEYISDAKITFSSGGFGLKPKIIIEAPTSSIRGRTELDPGKIDSAVELFENLVFNKKNLCFKWHEALVSITSVDPDFDLEEKSSFNKFEKIRLELIKDNKTKFK